MSAASELKLFPLQSSPCLRRQSRQALSCSAAAVAAPAPSVPADVGSLPQADRSALAEELGYRSIGADLPSNVSLTDVISSMPKSVSCSPTSNKSPICRGFQLACTMQAGMRTLQNVAVNHVHAQPLQYAGWLTTLIVHL